MGCRTGHHWAYGFVAITPSYASPLLTNNVLKLEEMDFQPKPLSALYMEPMQDFIRESKERVGDADQGEHDAAWTLLVGGVSSRSADEITDFLRAHNSRGGVQIRARRFMLVDHSQMAKRHALEGFI